MGLVWADAPAEQTGRAQHDLLVLQKPGAGWPQLPGYAPEAYSTGEALVALREAAMPVTDPAWRNGVRFLISTQARDGTWRVRTRMISPATVSPPYFTTGFPYAKDEYLSYAGTCWAVMALAGAIPVPGKPEPPQPAGSSGGDAPAWARTVLFGTLPQLTALLDGGLDPNSKTKNGTTLLMMAAPDVEKVRLLVARGADVNVRGASGHDALTIAAAYRGTAPSLQALIDAGAALQAPDGVRVRKSPLTLASMTGDLENVKLLLAHGASASEETAIANAVTFGYPDIVRTLVAAGASAGFTESSGINLLHWAVITNRPRSFPFWSKRMCGSTRWTTSVSRRYAPPPSISATLRRTRCSTPAPIERPQYRGTTALEQARFSNMPSRGRPAIKM
jgi:hypothetical protein